MSEAPYPEHLMKLYLELAHVVPKTCRSYREIKYREALSDADLAINPPDRSGISLDKWNERLKSATAKIRDVLATT